jgi:uncharacterized membrane protein YjjP (DUF1212 family)
MKKFFFGHALWLVYLGVLVEAVAVCSGWGGNWLLLASVVLIVAGIVTYVANEKRK